MVQRGTGVVGKTQMIGLTIHVRSITAQPSLLVDAEIWATLGGFDEQFAPAYCRTLIFVSLSGPWKQSSINPARQ